VTVGHIDLSIFRLIFSSEPLETFSPSGSAWRGAFGHELRRMVCVTREKVCTGCPVLSSCLYTYIFESPPPENTEKMRLYRTVPHPYALFLPGSDGSEGQNPSSGEEREPLDHDVERGSLATSLDLTLYGHAGEFFPHLLHAFSRAGERGVGSQRRPYTLTGASQYDLGSESWDRIYTPGRPPRQKAGMPVKIPSMPERVTLRFISPLRISVEKDLVTPDRLTFGVIFRTLLRRISMIRYFHGDSALELDYASLFSKAESVALTPLSLRWEEGIRYSSRQKTAMNMGGIVGNCSLDTTDLAPFWPFLWEGQWMQVGKLTTMGLGRYVINVPKTTDLSL